MGSASQATLLLAVATLVGAFIGSFFQYLLDFTRRERERQALRISLLSELKAIPALDDDSLLDVGVMENTEEILPSVVYKSNSGQIGKLTPEEAKAISKFYSAQLAFKSMAEESSGFQDEELRETMSDLLTAMEDARVGAIEELDENS